jgi:hypothetical protein
MAFSHHSGLVGATLSEDSHRDPGIQKALKTMDSRLRENDDFLWK